MKFFIKVFQKDTLKDPFTIADDVKVLGAELKDGLLTVSLERIIPEEKKKKKKSSKLNKKIEWGCFFPHLLNI